MSQQSLQQASFRAISGTTLDYNGDAYAAFQTEATIPAGAQFNEAFLIWLRVRLGVEDGDLPGLMQAFAEQEGAHNWSSLGSFGPASAMFSDDFNRADENVEASEDWTRTGGSAGAASILSNQVRFNTTDSLVGAVAFLSPDLGSADHWAQVELLAENNGAAIIRATDAANHIGARRTSTSWQVYKSVAGVFTSLGTTASPALVAGDILRAEAIGDQISAYLNGGLILGPFTETDHQAVTRTGFNARGVVSPAIDNFAAST